MLVAFLYTRDDRTYPLAQVQVGIGEANFEVDASLSDNLQVSVLLGQDVTDLLKILPDDKTCSPATLITQEEDALVTDSCRSKETQTSHEGATL